MILFFLILPICSAFILPPKLEADNANITQEYRENTNINLKTIFIEDYDLEITLRIKLSDPQAGTISTPSIKGVTPTMFNDGHVSIWKVRGSRDLLNLFLDYPLVFTPSINYNLDFELLYNLSSDRDTVQYKKKLIGVSGLNRYSSSMPPHSPLYNFNAKNIDGSGLLPTAGPLTVWKSVQSTEQVDAVITASEPGGKAVINYDLIEIGASNPYVSLDRVSFSFISKLSSTDSFTISKSAGTGGVMYVGGTDPLTSQGIAIFYFNLGYYVVHGTPNDPKGRLVYKMQEAPTGYDVLCFVFSNPNDLGTEDNSPQNNNSPTDNSIIKIYKNGVEVTSSNGMRDNYDQLNTVIENVRWFISFKGYFQNILQTIVYGRALSLSEIRDVTDYFSVEWSTN